jgi:hypothetical protein
MISFPLLLIWAAIATIVAGLPSVAPNALALREEYPEFKPSPGFPSLASLNLTTEMLHTVPETLRVYVPNCMADTADATHPVTNQLTARDDCGGGSFVTANVDDVIVCFNFLVALGDYLVTVTRSDEALGLAGARQVATHGSAYIIAHDVTSHTVAATAYQIALAVQWAFNHCNSGGQVAGKLWDIYVCLSCC